MKTATSSTTSVISLSEAGLGIIIIIIMIIIIINNIIIIMIIIINTVISIIIIISKQGLSSPPVGKPVYGVFFNEIIADLPLTLLCVRELKLAGYTNERTENGTDMDTVGSVGIVNTAGFSTTAVVPGIPSTWLLGDAIYADAYAFYLSLDNLPIALQTLTINDSMIASLLQLAQKQCSSNGTNTVLICTLLEKAGSSMQDEIKIAISRCIMNRYAIVTSSLYISLSS